MDLRKESDFSAESGSAYEELFASLRSMLHNPIKLFAIMLLALVSSTCISLSLSYSDPLEISSNYNTGSRFAIMAAVISQSLSIQFPEDLALLIVCYAILLIAFSMDRRYIKTPVVVILGLIFSIFSVAGKYFSSPVVGFDCYELAKILLSLFGFFLLLFSSVAVVRYLLINRSRKNCSSSTPNSKALMFVFDNHAFVLPFLIMLICWLPYLVLCFPGTTDPNDVLDQLQQYHGIYSRTAAWVDFDGDSWLYMNNNNPVFSTILTNLFFDFGSLIGSQNIGMFLLVSIQTLLLLAAFSSSFVLMKRFSTPYFLRMVLLLSFALSPVFPGYAICITKDTLFSVFVVFYVTLLILLICHQELFRKHKILLLAFFIDALLMALLRNNGVYMLALSAPFLILVRSSVCRIAGASGCVAICLYLCFGNLLLPALGVQGGSIKEMLSVPFQQTARYVVEHSDEVTSAQEKTINKILDYDSLADNYDPGLSDGVKETFKKESTANDLREYFKAWVEMGATHPDTYAAATMANCYAYFYPGISTGWIWTQLNRFGMYDAQDVSGAYRESGFDISQNESWRPYQIGLSKWYEVVSNSPLGVFTNMGICAWVVVFCFSILISERKIKEVLPYIPMLVLLLVCVASPQNGNPRYALPLICASPILLVYFLRKDNVFASGFSKVDGATGGRSHASARGLRRVSVAKQGMGYLVVGGVSAAIELGLFQILILLSVSIPVSNVVAVVVSTVFNFAVNKNVTFKSTSNILRSAVLYVLLLLFNTALSTIVISLLSSSGWAPILAKALMMCVIISWNFVIYRKVIFR